MKNRNKNYMYYNPRAALRAALILTNDLAIDAMA